jgi:polyisoprenoid-binding protein YceI
MSVPQRATVVAVTLAAALMSAGGATAEPRVLVLDPAASKVGFTLDATGHQVEGTMALKGGRVTFDPATGQASGEITLDLRSARTGNEGRDKTMHEKVLESATYPAAVFRAESVEGDVAPTGPSQVTLGGTLSFHGAEHKMKLPAKIQMRDGRLQADTTLAIPYVEWGLHDPSLMILRVAKVVQVKVAAIGRLEMPGAGEERRK